MLLQRKNDRRDARSRSPTRYADAAVAAGRFALESEQELGIDEDAGQGSLNARFERSRGSTITVEPEQRLHLRRGGRDRPAISPGRE